MAGISSLYSSLLFLAMSTSLALQVSGRSEPKPSFVYCPKSLDWLPVHPSEGGSFQVGSYTFGAEQCQSGGWDDVGKMELFFLLFLCSYSLISYSTVLLKFCKWTPELFQNCFCLWIAI